MLLRDFIAEARASLAEVYPEEEARTMVSFLCEDILGVKSHAHIIEPSIEVPDDRLPLLHEAMSRLIGGEPLQYVLGYSYFCGHRFKVSPSVLIPRPETEQLCDIVTHMALSAGKIGSVLDLCTGSGCIAWTFAGAFPGAEVTGADISPEALAIAAGQDINLPNGCRPPKFVRYDVLSGTDGIDGEFDIIVSNPPYVRESEKSMMRKNVLEHEPGLALFVPDDDPLVFYRAISAFAMKRLKAGGIGAVEINEAFGGPVADIFSSSGFVEVGIIEDFRAKIRFVTFKK